MEKIDTDYKQQTYRNYRLLTMKNALRLHGYCLWTFIFLQFFFIFYQILLIIYYNSMPKDKLHTMN